MVLIDRGLDHYTLEDWPKPAHVLRASFGLPFAVQLSGVAQLASKFPGVHGGGVPPVPIPNTEVKPSCADGTAWVTVWKNRTMPGKPCEAPGKPGAFLRTPRRACIDAWAMALNPRALSPPLKIHMSHAPG